MIRTQIYEVSAPEEAAAVSAMGIDHVGVLVGEGEFPREQPVPAALAIARAIAPPATLSALFLGADEDAIVRMAEALRPDIVHLGAAPELLPPDRTAALRARLKGVPVMRSIPVVGEQSIALAASFEDAADLLLLDSHRPSDRQIGALGITHDWSVSARIVNAVRLPVILAGGLGPDNVAAAIAAVRPWGVDSKTRTDVAGAHAKDLDKVRRFLDAARAAEP